MKSNAVALLTLLLFAISCGNENPVDSTTKPILLFKSGFEGNVYIDSVAYPYYEDYRFIRGVDSKTGFVWPINILGAENSALHYIDDDNHKAIFAELRTVTGYDGNETTALYQQQNYNLGVTQCPYEILNIKDGKKDLYIKFRIKLDSASLFQPDMWRTFFEWKTKEYAEGNGFRLISFIYTDNDGIPYWHFQGDKNPREPLWEINNKSVPVPVNEWFVNEFYWHWSDSEDGSATWKVNGELIGEHNGVITQNNNPIDFIMIGQIYGSANPKYQWVDDIEIWEMPSE